MSKKKYLVPLKNLKFIRSLMRNPKFHIYVCKAASPNSEQPQNPEERQNPFEFPNRNSESLQNTLRPSLSPDRPNIDSGTPQNASEPPTSSDRPNREWEPPQTQETPTLFDEQPPPDLGNFFPRSQQKKQTYTSQIQTFSLQLKNLQTLLDSTFLELLHLKKSNVISENQLILLNQNVNKLEDSMLKTISQNSLNQEKISTDSVHSFIFKNQHLLKTFYEFLPKLDEKFETLPRILYSLEKNFEIINERLLQASMAGELKVNQLVDILNSQILPEIRKISTEFSNFNNLNRESFSVKPQNISPESFLNLQNPFSETPNPFSETPNPFSEIDSNTNLNNLTSPEGSFFNLPTDSSSTQENIPLSVLGVSPTDLRRWKENYLPILDKLKRGETLSETESSTIKSARLDQISVLVSQNGALDPSGVFDPPSGSVLKVILSFKDSSMLNEPSSLVSSLKNETKKVRMHKSILNSLDYKTELFYIVVKNDKSRTMNMVFDNLYTILFKEGIANLMNGFVFLESIQLQTVYPKLTKNCLEQRGYGAPGRLNAQTFSTAVRDFCLVLGPSYMTGSKNDYLIKLRGISSQFIDFHALGLDIYEMTVGKLVTIFQNPIVIGQNSNVILRLAVKTRRSDYPFPFVPVASVSVGGFLTNSNPQNKKRSILSFNEINEPNEENTNP